MSDHITSFRSKRAVEARTSLESNPTIFSDQQQNILRLLALELSNEEIQTKLGIARPTLNRHIRDIKDRQSGKKSPCKSGRKEMKKQELLDLHSEGKTVRQIMDQTGFTYDTVKRYFRELGVTPHPDRTPGLTAAEAAGIIYVTERNVILRRIARGMNVNQMASVDNHSRDFILHQMHNHEIEIPEDERWVLDAKTQTKRSWHPKNRETRKQTAVDRTYDASIVRTYKPS